MGLPGALSEKLAGVKMKRKILILSLQSEIARPLDGGNNLAFQLYSVLGCAFDITRLVITPASGYQVEISQGLGFVERFIPSNIDLIHALVCGEGAALDVTPVADAAPLEFYSSRLYDAYLEEYETTDIILHDSPFLVDLDVFAGIDDKPRVYNALDRQMSGYRSPLFDPAVIFDVDFFRSAESRILGISDLVLSASDGACSEYRNKSLVDNILFLSVPSDSDTSSVSDDWINECRYVLSILDSLRSIKPRPSPILVLNNYDSFAWTNGGATRTRGLYEAVQNWAPVVFLTFSVNGMLGKRRLSSGITVIGVPKSPEHIFDQERVDVSRGIATDDVIAGHFAPTNKYIIGMYRIFRKLARLIIVEHCYMSSVPYYFGDKFIYSSQNYEAGLKRQMLEGHPFVEELLPEAERLESIAVECAQAIVAVSHEDASDLVRGKKIASRVIVIRNGASSPRLDVDTLTLESVRAKLGSVNVVFVGSFWMPNIHAAQIIVENIAPQCKNIQFHLVGSVCNAVDYAPGNVTLWGILDDVTKSAVMQACSLAINPMPFGGGSNVKLADYIGHGLYVVTSEIGKRGYPQAVDEHVGVSDIDGFANAINSALLMNELQSESAKQARRELFNRELSIEALSLRYLEFLRGIRG